MKGNNAKFWRWTSFGYYCTVCAEGAIRCGVTKPLRKFAITTAGVSYGASRNDRRRGRIGVHNQCAAGTIVCNGNKQCATGTISMQPKRAVCSWNEQRATKAISEQGKQSAGPC